jgi:hypothetical protein
MRPQRPFPAIFEPMNAVPTERHHRRSALSAKSAQLAAFLRRRIVPDLMSRTAIRGRLKVSL